MHYQIKISNIFTDEVATIKFQINTNHTEDPADLKCQGQ